MMERILIALVLLASLATPALADSLPQGWQSHKFNGPNQPTVEAGVVTFKLFDRKCSDIDYGDGRGESDCLNGNIRSTINYRGPTGRLGETMEYRFDVRIDPSFKFQPFRNPAAINLLPGGIDSRLRIASWEGPLLHNFIYIVRADAQRGITFLGRQCQPPEEFGTWVSIAMTIRWANDERGWIKLTCNDRIVYADEDVATNQAPHCYASNVCETGKFKDPKSFIYLLGPLVGGYGHDYAKHGFETPFIDIQEDGIVISMRNLSVARGGELYSKADREQVALLQEALNALGCDVGTADGIAGRRTKARALDCRYFGEGRLPEKLTLASLPTFLSLYTADGVADLPRETPQSTAPKVLVSGAYSELLSNGDAILNVEARTEGTEDGALTMAFILIGRFDDDGHTSRLEVLFGDDLGRPIPAAVARCPSVRTETWGDGTTHAVLGLSRVGTQFRAPSAKCLADALPVAIGVKVRTLVALFPEFAKQLASPRTGGLIEHGGIRAFVEMVANGEVAVTE